MINCIYNTMAKFIIPNLYVQSKKLITQIIVRTWVLDVQFTTKNRPDLKTNKAT